MSEKNIQTEPMVFVDSWTASYTYAVGELAGKFMEGLKNKKILASHCSKSGLTYLPPRAYCERSFEKCDSLVEAKLEGDLEVGTITTAPFQGSPEPPYAVAFVRLDGVDTAIAGYVRGLDFSDPEAAMKRLKRGSRMRVEFIDEPQGRVTDYFFVPV